MEAKTRGILHILEEDARTPAEKIATMTGLPVEEVRAAIAEAEQSRIILRYKTTINWEKAGEEEVWALIEVRVQPQRDVGFDAIAERIYRFPEAHSVYLMSGAYDLALLVAGKTMQQVAAFVSEKVAPMEGVQGTTTHFLLKRYKEDGLILTDREERQRLPYSP